VEIRLCFLSRLRGDERHSYLAALLSLLSTVPASRESTGAFARQTEGTFTPTTPTTKSLVSYLVCVETRDYGMGWRRLVGSLTLKVSFSKEPYRRDYILQERPMILRRLLIVASPYLCFLCLVLARVLRLSCSRESNRVFTDSVEIKHKRQEGRGKREERREKREERRGKRAERREKREERREKREETVPRTKEKTQRCHSLLSPGCLAVVRAKVPSETVSRQNTRNKREEGREKREETKERRDKKQECLVIYLVSCVMCTCV